MQNIQMHLYQKQGVFPEFSSALFKSALDFKHFPKKMTLIASLFPTLPTTKDMVRKMSKNSRLRGPLDRQHGKPAETLIQS